MTDLQARAEAAADAVCKNVPLHLLPHEVWLIARDAALHALQSEGWRPISEAKPQFIDHMRPILAFWRMRGWRETYWDVDEEFDERPSWWLSPEEGWRCPGDQCIPTEQGAVTHFMPLPTPPEGETP